MNRRVVTYFGLRFVLLAVFLLSATVVHGPVAVVGCIVAGVGGLLTCIGVNAGGPGERAGARREQVHYERIRPPQGDWPPYDPGRVVEGELADTP